MKQVTKGTIKKLIKENGVVQFYMMPCKVQLINMWVKPVDCKVNSLKELEKIIAEFEYYNCNNQLGNYAKFYI